MLMTQKCVCLAQTFLQFYIQILAWWLPQWLIGEESAWQCRRCRFDPWVWKIPRCGKLEPTPVFLPWKFHGQRILVEFSLWGCKGVRHNWVTEHTRTALIQSSEYVFQTLGTHKYNSWCISHPESECPLVVLKSAKGTFICLTAHPGNVNVFFDVSMFLIPQLILTESPASFFYFHQNHSNAKGYHDLFQTVEYNLPWNLFCLYLIYSTE